MTEHNRQFDADEPQISPRLHQDLRALFEPPGAVPRQVDKAIVDQARRRLIRPRRLIIPLRWAAATAAAAVIVLGMLLYHGSTPQNHQSSIIHHQSGRLGPADVDGNGRVDILDAFRLARNIESRGPADMKWDLNGDGLVDRKDVDAVAFAAVRLDPRPQASRGEGVGTPNATNRVWEPFPPLRREAILASLFPCRDVLVTSDTQGQASPEQRRRNSAAANSLCLSRVLEILVAWNGWQRQAQLGDGSNRSGKEPSPRPSALTRPPVSTARTAQNSTKWDAASSFGNSLNNKGARS